jgi:hypothetical protein
MNYSTEEREAIGLCIALEALNDIVNHALLTVCQISEGSGEAEIRFPTRIHQSMFLVRLLDFAKEGGDATLTGVNGSCLAVLQAACIGKSFDVENSVDALRESTSALASWLDATTPLTLWLPSLNVEAKLVVPRHQFLYIAGNQAKHNISRLTGLSKLVAGMLTENGYPTSPEQVPIALDDFHEHLHEDYFAYYGTWLAELLNNVRWGIQTYLLPTFRASFTPAVDGSAIYGYRYPASITNANPREWFWRLMNNVRTGPYLKPFTGTRYAKKEILR